MAFPKEAWYKPIPRRGTACTLASADKEFVSRADRWLTPVTQPLLNADRLQSVLGRVPHECVRPVHGPLPPPPPLPQPTLRHDERVNALSEPKLCAVVSLVQCLTHRLTDVVIFSAHVV